MGAGARCPQLAARHTAGLDLEVRPPPVHLRVGGDERTTRRGAMPGGGAARRALRCGAAGHRGVHVRADGAGVAGGHHPRGASPHVVGPTAVVRHRSAHVAGRLATFTTAQLAMSDER